MTAFSLSWSMGVLCKITGSEAQTSRDGGGGGGGRDVNNRSASQGVGVALNSAPSHPLLTLATRRCSVARKSHAEALFTPHAFFFVSYPSLPGQCFAPPPPPPPVPPTHRLQSRDSPLQFFPCHSGLRESRKSSEHRRACHVRPGPRVASR